MMALSAVFIFTLIWDKCPIGGIPLCIYIYIVYHSIISLHFCGPYPGYHAGTGIALLTRCRRCCWSSESFALLRDWHGTRHSSWSIVFFFFCESWWYLVIVNLNLINLVVLLFSFHVFNWKQHVICFFFAKFIWLGKIASIWAGQGMS